MCHPPGQICHHPKFAASPPGGSVNRRYRVSLNLRHSHPSWRPGRPRSTIPPPASTPLQPCCAKPPPAPPL
ncbi:hypothetical protein E2C01_044928 [Portunus trituberculatus]|uniref:Uncharacterized protein n=1 Tax=Portunus trituberculatus TaxID=210409 RepID=A0A5B7FTD9_PORTR|nr:hypothetical protein [Portunus trituberculatus]